MKKEYLVGIDIGASSVRTGIIDFDGNEVGGYQIPTDIIFDKGGRVIYDADEFVRRIYETTRLAIEKAGINPEKIAAMSFGGLRSTLAIYKEDGSFAYPLVSYMDGTYMEMQEAFAASLQKHNISKSDFCRILGQAVHGRPLTIAKIIKDDPELYKTFYKYGNMTLMVGRAYGMREFLMDSDNANVHGFYDVFKREYAKELEPVWNELGISGEKAADAVSPGTLIGHVTEEVAEKTGMAAGTPIYMGTGDQQCNDLGAGCIEEGMFSFCMGTAAMVAMRSNNPIEDSSGALFINGAAVDAWIAQGACSTSAQAHKWLRDKLYAKEHELEKSGGRNAYEIMDEEAEKSGRGSNGLLFLPWFGGSSIHGDYDPKGGFLGINYLHTRGDMVRAFFEGVSYELSVNVKAIVEATGVEAKVIRVTGGGARSKLWMQTLADFCNLPLEFVEAKEVGTIGAAMLAGVGSGVFDDLKEAADRMVHIKKRMEPNLENAHFYAELSKIYGGIYEASCSDAYKNLAAYQRKYF